MMTLIELMNKILSMLIWKLNLFLSIQQLKIKLSIIMVDPLEINL